jgi:hypothetical protein
MYKRIAKGVLAAVVLACGSAGCCWYRNWVDVSYPERYECESRSAVTSALTTQTENGHVLDQTVWNVCFDPGTDRLTPAGVRALAYLGRRRPMPDTIIYLQQANDLPTEGKTPEQWVEARVKLDESRKNTVERFLLARTGLEFQVVPHNPAEPSLYGPEAVSIIRDIGGSAHGTLAAPAGAGAAGGAGAPAGGGAPGGGK